jgi:predicted DNA binding CopG/RHH family protein
MKKEFQKKTFKNEEEEAKWWDKQQDTLADEFERAAAEGKLGHGTVARKGITPTTTIRLAPEDILLARTQAERRGLRYQTYLKMVIHEALRSNGARNKPKTARKTEPVKARVARSH